MDEAAPAGTARYSRFWLYTPFVLLLLIAVAWSAAWFVIRSRASEAVDAWFATEARAGRQWTCQDRSIGGYPFRIELICNSLSLKQGAVTASLGRVESVAQVYQPRFIITEIEGPLQQLHAFTGQRSGDCHAAGGGRCWGYPAPSAAAAPETPPSRPQR